MDIDGGVEGCKFVPIIQEGCKFVPIIQERCKFVPIIQEGCKLEGCKFVPIIQDDGALSHSGCVCQFSVFYSCRSRATRKAVYLYSKSEI